MRNWHRRLSIVVAIFMLLLGVTGVLLQLDGLSARRGPGGAAPAGMAAPSDEAVQAMVRAALGGVHRAAPGATLMGLNLRLAGPAPSAEVFVDDHGLRRLQLDPRSGEPVAGGGEDHGLHALVLSLHNGEILGRTGQGIGLACGLVLAALAITGIVMYVQACQRRRHIGGLRRWLW